MYVIKANQVISDFINTPYFAKTYGSWVTDKGDVIPVHLDDGHQLVAEKIFSKKYKGKNVFGLGYAVGFQNGWIRVVHEWSGVAVEYSTLKPASIASLSTVDKFIDHAEVVARTRKSGRYGVVFEIYEYKMNDKGLLSGDVKASADVNDPEKIMPTWKRFRSMMARVKGNTLPIFNEGYLSFREFTELIK